MPRIWLAWHASIRSLRGAQLDRADLRLSDLQHADLRRADLNEADLRWANLENTDLRDTILFGADLTGASIKDIRQLNPNMLGARVAVDRVTGRATTLKDTTMFKG
jgi:uncharacterized protein YjbI with pentapeptide repeats